MKLHIAKVHRIYWFIVCFDAVRSGDFVITRRQSSEERCRPSTAEECRKHPNDSNGTSSTVAPLTTTAGDTDHDGGRSTSDVLTRATSTFTYRRGISIDGGTTNITTAPGSGTVRRKMSESAVLALIKEQSTSRDDSEHSSSLRGATGAGESIMDGRISRSTSTRLS